MDQKTQQDLEQRINNIIQKYNLPNDEDILHAMAVCYRKGIKNFNILRTQENYYDLSLEQRIQIIPVLNNINQLTKCLLYENRPAKETDNCLEYSKYYLICYQYKRKYLEPHFYSYIRQFAHQEKWSYLKKQDYKFDLVDQNSEVAHQLMDAKYNGMSAIGLKKDIPIIIDKNLIDEKVEKVMVGGLHPFVKIILNVSDLLKLPNCHIVDCTEPIK